MNNHKLTLTRRPNYIEAACKCGQWSQFVSNWRGASGQKVDYIKREYSEHKAGAND